MRSLMTAISEVMRSLFVQQPPPATVQPKKPTQQPLVPVPPQEQPKNQPHQIPQGYMQYHFKCWLCSGETAFVCPVPTQDIYLTLECSRCGVENRVKIEPPLKLK